MTGLGILSWSGLAQRNQTQQSNRIHINQRAVGYHHTMLFPHAFNMDHTFPSPFRTIGHKVAFAAVVEEYLYKSVHISGQKNCMYLDVCGGLPSEMVMWICVCAL